MTGGRWLRPAVAAVAALVAGFVWLDQVGESERMGGVVLLGLATVLLSLPGWRAAGTLAAALAAWFGALGAIELVPDLVDPDPSVADAVGGAAYFGTPFLGRELGLALTIGAIVAVIGATAILARRRGALLPRPIEPSAWTPRSGSSRLIGPSRLIGGWRPVAIGAAVAALIVIPDLDIYFARAPTEPSWDASNLELWDYLIWQGSTPMADFFYPYGHQWLYSVVPWGPLVAWLARAAMIAIAGWSLWRLSGRRAAPVALCLLALPLIGLWNEQLWRYLPGFLLAVSYAALGPARHARPVRDHLVFGAACLLTAVLEVDLMLYGLAGCALVLLADLLSGAIRGRPLGVLRGLLVDAIPVAFALATVVVLWLATGAAEGNLRFFTGLGGVSAASAPYLLLVPGLDTLSLAPSAHAIYLALPGMLIVAGLGWALLRGPGGRAISVLLLAAAGVTLLFAFKDLVRPTDDRLLVIALVAVIWSALLIERWTVAAAAAAGAFLAALALTISDGDDDPIDDYASRVVAAPGRVVDLVLLPTRTDQFEHDLEQRFTASSYARFPEAEIALDYMGALDDAGGDPSDLAVLGDAQLLYAFFGADPPFHAEFYDSAPLAEQREMLERLERDPPEHLVWRRGFQVDEVPYPVRDPLIFAWAAGSYVPLDRRQARTQSTTQVLRRRQPGEPVAIDYWHGMLGASDLGYVPAYSELDQAPGCELQSSDCAPVALLEGGPPYLGQPLEFRVRDGGRRYRVRFGGRDGVSSYAVRLDRLWFWPLISDRARFEVVTPGYSIETRLVHAGDALY